MLDSTGLQFTVVVGELPDDTFSVYEFDIAETLSEVFTLTLTAFSKASHVAPADVLEQNVTLRIYQDGLLLRQFRGVVAEFCRGAAGDHRTRYEMVVSSPLWRLGIGRNSRIFQHKNTESIVRVMLDDHGVADTRFNLVREPEEREYCVQHRESDLAFLKRLAAEEGWHFRVEHGEERSELIIADHHRDSLKLENAPYNAMAGGSSRQSCIYRFETTERVGVAGVAMKDYTFRNPAYGLDHVEVAANLQHQRPDYEHYDYPGRYKQDASGEPFARARLDGLRRNTSTANGESNRADFTAGARVSLEDHFDEAANTEWLLTGVIHHGVQPQALEEEAGGEPTTYHNKFSAVPATVNWRPSNETCRPVMDGPQIARVTGPAGEEIYCDDHGRVKVKFPWDRYGTDDEHSSAWLRVSQGWAGGQYGFMALPRVGHEVIVSFLDGDPDQPIITGRTYHATNTPPYSLPTNRTRTVLRTQTHQGGGYNELSFEDEKEKQLVYLRAQKDHELEVYNDQKYSVGNDREKHIGNDQRLNVTRDEEIEIGRDQKTNIVQDQTLTVGRDRFTNIGRHYRLEVTDRRHEFSHANHDLEVGGHYTQKVQGKVVVEAGESALIHTRNLTLTGSESVVIQGPGGKITIGSGGVTVDSPSIKLNGPVAVATGAAAQIRTLESAAREGTPLVDICSACGDGA
ncbi:type VI secretion system Vgr family protein [Marinobacter sp. F3R11]|uniref:type VI secretion system Vgr family protein n=1 Tax=Marinobacter sp. F3R11 TaxID=2267231 RepID=UPI000DEAE9C5|nr:type VI secretion system tip protein TssI/VgrG [Marinobacter sp. F3R11]RBW48981.1 type VI secretion system tip protein VgrG [Marinobacter sp. F3R11]